MKPRAPLPLCVCVSVGEGGLAPCVCVCAWVFLGIVLRHEVPSCPFHSLNPTSPLLAARFAMTARL